LRQWLSSFSFQYAVLPWGSIEVRDGRDDDRSGKPYRLTATMKN